MKERKLNLVTGLVISFFFAFTVLFYGPLSQYLSNAEELWFSLSDVLRVILPVSIAAIVLPTLFFLIIPSEAGGFFLKLFFGISLAMYVQGNYLRSNYGTGVLDGTEIDWGSYTGYGIFNVILWIVLIALPFVAGWLLRKKEGKEEDLKKLLIVGALFFTVIQVPALIVQGVTYQPNENANLKISTKGIFEVSPEDNIIIFILDGMDEAYYEAYLEKNNEYTDGLEGFVHYGNTLSSGARTTIGVPSMLTGIPYHKQKAYSEYIQDIYQSDNPISVLHDDGYDIGIYSEPTLFPVSASDYVSNFGKRGREVGSYHILTKKIYKLDLFRFLPHFLKRYVWFDTAEFDEAKDLESTYRPDDAKLYRLFKKSGFKILDKKEKSFQLYHLYGAHSPFTLTADGEASDSKTSREEQIEGVFRILSEMLADLKDKGLYDQATIIVTADHGDTNIAEHPLFMVKRSGDTSAYSESEVPASLFDVAIFLAGLADTKLPGQNYGTKIESLTEDMVRERHMFRNLRGGTTGYIVEEYKTDGKADEPEKLQLVQTYESNEDENTPYVLGTKLLFTADATGNKYCLEGIGYNTGFRSRMYGPYAKFSFPIENLPKSGELICTMNIRPTEGEWNTRIEANGEVVFDGLLDQKTIKENLKFTIPVSVFKKGNVLKLDFRFTDVPEDEMEIEDIKKRTETLSLKTMTIDINKEKSSK